MRILVCGGREFGDWPGTWLSINEMKRHKQEYDYLFNWLDNFVNDNQIELDDLTLICGMARGADSAAFAWADSIMIPVEKYPANWTVFGKAAGYIRNKQMLTEGKPDLVVAFPGGKGTANMVKLAKEAGVEVIEVPYDR